MATTTNFGWETPDDTDLVKDGALAIRTLGSAIDTSLVDLKGGTTGQVLSKASNTDMDFTWVAQDDSNAIQNAIVDAKGDLITATAADTPARLAVGTNGQYLQADSSTASGLVWATLPSSGLTLINQSTFSAVANTGTTFDGVFSSSYFDYLLVIENIFSSVNDTEIHIQGRIATPSTISTGYYGITRRLNFAAGTADFASDNAAQFILGKVSTSVDGCLAGIYHVSQVGNTSGQFKMQGLGTDGASIGPDLFGGKIQNSQTYTGFILKASSGNITGRVSVYGMAK